MKFALAAAAALLAAPVVAQEAPASAPATDPVSAPAQTMQSAPADPAAPAPAGGYQPAGPALSAPAAPGQQVIFRPAATPDQAYPAPPPMDSYPVCKKGQFDKCRNPGGK